MYDFVLLQLWELIVLPEQKIEMDWGMDLSKLSSPLAFAVANCRFQGSHPRGRGDYWTADIKAVRRGEFCKVFNNVLFVETPGEMAALSGMENRDGIDRFIKPEFARRQAEFIQFLRDENDRDRQAMGMLWQLFDGHEYATVGHATAAYLAARSLTHPFGVGFVNAEGEYELLGIEPCEDSGFEAILYPAFDELGVHTGRILSRCTG